MEALKRAMTIGAENLPYFDPRSMLLRAEGVNIIIHNNFMLRYVLCIDLSLLTNDNSNR